MNLAIELTPKTLLKFKETEVLIFRNSEQVSKLPVKNSKLLDLLKNISKAPQVFNENLNELIKPLLTQGVLSFSCDKGLERKKSIPTRIH